MVLMVAVGGQQALLLDKGEAGIVSGRVLLPSKPQLDAHRIMLRFIFIGDGSPGTVPQGEERQEELRDLTRATTDNLQGASFEHCVQAGSSLCWNLFAVRSGSNLVPSPGLKSFLYVIKLAFKFTDHFSVT